MVPEKETWSGSCRNFEAGFNVYTILCIKNVSKTAFLHHNTTTVCSPSAATIFPLWMRPGLHKLQNKANRLPFSGCRCGGAVFECKKFPVIAGREVLVQPASCYASFLLAGTFSTYNDLPLKIHTASLVYQLRIQSACPHLILLDMQRRPYFQWFKTAVESKSPGLRAMEIISKTQHSHAQVLDPKFFQSNRITADNLPPKSTPQTGHGTRTIPIRLVLPQTTAHLPSVKSRAYTGNLRAMSSKIPLPTLKNSWS